MPPGPLRGDHRRAGANVIVCQHPTIAQIDRATGADPRGNNVIEVGVRRRRSGDISGSISRRNQYCGSEIRQRYQQRERGYNAMHASSFPPAAMKLGRSRARK